MRKIILLVLLVCTGQYAYCQYAALMHVAENKLMCNEEKFTYYLETSGFERYANTYSNSYYENNRLYNTRFTYHDTGYVTYNTNNPSEYERIKHFVESSCLQQHSTAKAIYYECNVKKIFDLQLILDGYLEDAKTYEIRMYQDVAWTYY